MAIASIAISVGGAVLGSVASKFLLGSGDSGGGTSGQSASAMEQVAQNNAAAQAQIASEQFKQYKATYLPLETSFVNKAAQQQNDPYLMNRALGAVQASGMGALAQNQARLAATSGDPSQPGAQYRRAGLDIAQAGIGSGAQNTARTQALSIGDARLTAALGLGRGLDAAAAQGFAGSSANAMGLASLAHTQENAQAQALGNIVGTGANAVGKWLDNRNTGQDNAATYWE